MSLFFAWSSMIARKKTSLNHNHILGGSKNYYIVIPANAGTPCPGS